MPLLSPTAIRDVLKESGLTDQTDIKKILEANSLSPNDVIQEVGYILRGGESSAIKLRAAETALKLNGLLNNRDEGPTAPIVNIIINDSANIENPILIPRRQ
jgi:hypothetical protein